MWMCVCVRVHTRVCVCVCARTRVCVCVGAYVHTCLCIHLYVRMYVQAYTYVHMYVLVCVLKGVSCWACMDVYLKAIFTYIHVYSPGQYFNISSQYQYQSKTDNTISTILNSQYINYQHFSEQVQLPPFAVQEQSG